MSSSPDGRSVSNYDRPNLEAEDEDLDVQSSGESPTSQRSSSFLMSLQDDGSVDSITRNVVAPLLGQLLDGIDETAHALNDETASSVSVDVVPASSKAVSEATSTTPGHDADSEFDPPGPCAAVVSEACADTEERVISDVVEDMDSKTAGGEK